MVFNYNQQLGWGVRENEENSNRRIHSNKNILKLNKQGTERSLFIMFNDTIHRQPSEIISIIVLYNT